MVVDMRDVNAIDENMRELPVSDRDQTAGGETVKDVDLVAELLTPERVFDLAIGLLHGMGYECVSEDRIDDFTGRIDGVFRKSNSLGDREHSGYLRIISVYRSGQKIHVEFYNFLTKFPADSVEMQEVSESLKKLFERERSIILDIHE
jgi:hypothetical protein